MHVPIHVFIQHLLCISLLSVFYCCVRNYYQLSSIKQHKFTITQLVRQKSGCGTFGFSAQGLTGCKRGGGQSSTSNLESRVVLLITAVVTDRIHFLAVVGLRGLCCLLISQAGTALCSQLPEGAVRSLPHGTFHSATENLPCIKRDIPPV